MIVEFFGPPGAGKTFLLRQLTATDGREVRVLARSAIMRGVLSYALRHPLSFFVWSVELLIHAQGLLRYKAGLLARSMAARSVAERAAPESVLYIDEGLTQRLLTIFDAPLSHRHVRFLLGVTPLPEVVIVMHGGAFERFTTAPNRTNSPRVRQGEAAFKSWVASVQHNARGIEAALSPRTHVIACTRGEPTADPAAVRGHIDQVREVL